METFLLTNLEESINNTNCEKLRNIKNNIYITMSIKMTTIIIYL